MPSLKYFAWFVSFKNVFKEMVNIMTLEVRKQKCKRKCDFKRPAYNVRSTWGMMLLVLWQRGGQYSWFILSFAQKENGGMFHLKTALQQEIGGSSDQEDNVLLCYQMSYLLHTVNSAAPLLLIPYRLWLLINKLFTVYVGMFLFVSGLQEHTWLSRLWRFFNSSIRVS